MLEKIEEMWALDIFEPYGEMSSGFSTILEAKDRFMKHCPAYYPWSLRHVQERTSESAMCYLQRRHLSMSTTCAWGARSPNGTYGNVTTRAVVSRDAPHQRNILRYSTTKTWEIWVICILDTTENCMHLAAFTLITLRVTTEKIHLMIVEAARWGKTIAIKYKKTHQ